MKQFSQAFGKNFAAHKDLVRTRQFELGGHVFKVKIPLTAEYEAMVSRLKNLDEETVEKYYQELTSNLHQEKDDEAAKEMGIEYTENDIIIQGRSMRDAARNKYLTELRITEMIRLLVPEESGFDMSTVTYAMIEELFPFAIQIEMLEKISATIQPEYSQEKVK